MKLAARYCLLAMGIMIMAAGIVIVTKTNLGTSPISSLGYILHLSFTDISYGTWMLAWNGALLVGQIIILRRRFKAAALLQIPISILFSIGIDACSHAFSFIAPVSYLESLAFLILGIVVLAFGVACTIVANVVMNCGEAFVCAITSKTGWNFGYTKVGFDLTCVIVAVGASLILLNSIQGIREGTLIAAFATGFIANVFIRLLGGIKPALVHQKARLSRKHESLT